MYGEIDSYSRAIRGVEVILEEAPVRDSKSMSKIESETQVVQGHARTAMSSSESRYQQKLGNSFVHTVLRLIEESKEGTSPGTCVSLGNVFGISG